VKIVDIKMYKVSYPIRGQWGAGIQLENNSGIVEVFTDEGISGLGEMNQVGAHSSNSGGVLYEDLLDKVIKPRLIGEDPLNIRSVWKKACEASASAGIRRLDASAAVEIACWDILGKTYEQPVHKLLGYSVDKFPVYAAPSLKQPEVILEECEEYKARGFKAIKLRIGLGMVGLDDYRSLKKDIQILQGARKIFGSEMVIGVDTDRTYDHLSATKLAPVLEEIDVTWFEEPLTSIKSPDNDTYVNEMVSLKNKINVPLSGGQGFVGRHEFKEIVSRQAVDIVQPDLIFAGGITETIAIADIASAWGVRCMPHVSCGAGTDIQFLATAYAMAAMSYEMYACYPIYDTPLRTELPIEQIKIVDGDLILPQTPGIGIEFNREALEKYLKK